METAESRGEVVDCLPNGTVLFCVRYLRNREQRVEGFSHSMVITLEQVN